MQKILLTLFSFLIGITIVNAQVLEIFSIDDNVVREFEQGEPGALASILQLKHQIENSDNWSEDNRNKYITIVKILRDYYSKQGLYTDQEILLNNAIRIFNLRDREPNNPYIRFLWICKMNSQAEMKDYDSALNYGHVALSMYEEVNDYGLDYGLLCMSISSAYFEKGDLLSAKLYVDEAYDVFQDKSISCEEKDWNYYLVLNSRGLVYHKLKREEESIANFKEVVDNASPELLGAHYYLAMNNLASAYLISNRIQDAIEILKRIPEVTPDLRYIKYSNLCFAYYLVGDSLNTEKYIELFNKNALSNEYSIIANFSEVEREPYLSRCNKELVYMNNMMAYSNNMLINEAFKINVYAREISLFLNSYTHTKSYDNPNSLRLNSLRQQLTKKGLPSMQSDSIRREIVELEKQILRSDTNFVNKLPFNDRSTENVISTLKDDEAVVLFCYIHKLVSTTDSKAHYGAFVLRSGDKHPKLIQLAEVDSAEDIFYNNTPTEEFISQLYTETNAKKLYSFLWKPLEESLKGAHVVYYSTVGPLSTINFDALIDIEGVRLKDELDLIMLSSPSEKKDIDRKSQNDRFIAFGAPAFNWDAQSMADNSKKYDQFSGEDIAENIRYRGDHYRGDWQDIPGTKKEIEAVSPLVTQKGMHSTVYLGKDANEEAFKAISGNSPRILHIATHGFTISTQSQYNNSTFAQSVSGFTPNNNYMLWAGLVLSGGNTTWKGEQIPNGVEDGILTADEISRLDLSNTELVVLSACETARGHIDPIEGVWGLQRAFKQAGVKTILMTLWKVSDDVTAMFMEQFYKNLMKGKTVRQSVKIAQDYLINHGASDPFYWAPFVVLD